MRNQAPNVKAGGNVYPTRFVKMDVTDDQCVLQATAGARTVGISGRGARTANGATSDFPNSPYIAIAGENCEIYGLGDVCELDIGSGGCTAGDALKSDASGQGITAGAGDFAGALALQTRNSGEKALVQVLHTFGDVSAASSVASDVPLYFGDASDSGMMFSTADASDPATVLFVDDTSQQLHITDKGARATDWNLSAATHPELYIHSNTTPATDYLYLGGHDGTSAYINVAGGTTLNLQSGGTTRLAFVDGKVFIGDTADANLTLGLCINQGANDDGILTLKSSDVTHGMTGTAETDTYGIVSKNVATEGGLKIIGLSEGEEGLMLHGYGGTQDTTDAPTTTSVAAIQLVGGYANTTAVQLIGATGNLLNVANNNAGTLVNEFIVKGDGELYSNQSATVGTFDAFDDALMCADLSYHLSNEYQKVVGYNRELFRQVGILADDPEGKGGMYSVTKMAMLTLCAVGQLGRQLNAVASRLGLKLTNDGATPLLAAP